MNYWKKMAFVLALVAGLCGGAWANDWGHQNKDRARDSHQGRSANAGAASTSRNNPNYQHRNSQGVYAPNRTWGRGNPNGTYYPYPNKRTWGSGPYGTYYPNNGTWGSGPNGTYYPNSGTWGNGGYGGYGGANNDYQRGYNDGLNIGRNDRRTGRKYQPAQYKTYKNNNMTYRRGFGVGYNQGFGRGW
jgi:hypothetical protein